VTGTPKLDWSWRDPRIRALHAVGWSARRIGRCIGVGHQGVIDRKAFLGLRSPPPHARRAKERAAVKRRPPPREQGEPDRRPGAVYVLTSKLIRGRSVGARGGDLPR
jgi:hypothetical protein